MEIVEIVKALKEKLSRLEVELELEEKSAKLNEVRGELADSRALHSAPLHWNTVPPAIILASAGAEASVTL